MKSIDDLLKDHDFFQSFPEDFRKTIGGCGKLAHFRPGEYLAREGDPADAFYLVRHGVASIEFHMPQNGARILQTLGPGEITGWSWLFPPNRWTNDVRARDDLAVIVFNGQCLREKCEANHSLGYLLMKSFACVMTQRLQNARLQLLDVYGKSYSP